MPLIGGCADTECAPHPPVSDETARLTVRDVPESGKRGDLVKGVSQRRFWTRFPQRFANFVQGRWREPGGRAAGGTLGSDAPGLTPHATSVTGGRSLSLSEPHLSRLQNADKELSPRTAQGREG